MSEKNLYIVTQPVSTDIQTSINEFLKPEILSSHNKWFCPSCNLLSERTQETCIINSAPILIIQLFRFSNQGGQLVKNENFFNCSESEWNKDLAIPITMEDEVSFTNKYSLIATINHSGVWIGVITGLLSRTYTPLVGALAMIGRLLMLENSVNNTASYILF